MIENIIIRAVGGFYYIKSEDEIIECKAKGKFRNLSLSPLVGDIVSFDKNEKIITEIHKRKNQFLRPAFANLDLLVLVLSTTQPNVNYLVADKLCAICQNKGAQVVIVITKTDLKEDNQVKAIYEKAGYTVLVIDDENSKNIDALKEIMKDKLVAFAGNSGVGKTTLLNRIFNNLDLKTNEISKKLGRGKHTTRHVEIYLQNSLMIADTPGFSSLELDGENFISAADLKDAFIEFEKYKGECKFADCRHISEKGCRVLKAVEDEDIAKTRHESYVALFERQKLIKDWQKK